MIGEVKTIDGKRFNLVAQNLTKLEAQRKAGWAGKITYVRTERLGRGNYRVWVGPLKP